MRELQLRFQQTLRGLWAGLRQWCGDSAYETYLACAAQKRASKPLSAAEFYVEHLNRKYSRPNRCC